MHGWDCYASVGITVGINLSLDTHLYRPQLLDETLLLLRQLRVAPRDCAADLLERLLELPLVLPEL